MICFYILLQLEETSKKMKKLFNNNKDTKNENIQVLINILIPTVVRIYNSGIKNISIDLLCKANIELPKKTDFTDCHYIDAEGVICEQLANSYIDDYKKHSK